MLLLYFKRMVIFVYVNFKFVTFLHFYQIGLFLFSYVDDFGHFQICTIHFFVFTLRSFWSICDINYEIVYTVVTNPLGLSS